MHTLTYITVRGTNALRLHVVTTPNHATAAALWRSLCDAARAPGGATRAPRWWHQGRLMA